MTTILIHKTAHSPEVTLEDIQAASDFETLAHMRDVVLQCVSQVGIDACQDALAALERAEAKLYQP